MPGFLRKSPWSMSHRRQSFCFTLSLPLLLSKSPHHARKSVVHARDLSSPHNLSQVYKGITLARGSIDWSNPRCDTGLTARGSVPSCEAARDTNRREALPVIRHLLD